MEAAHMRHLLRFFEACLALSNGFLGSLAVGGRLVQFPGGPLPALNLVKFD